MLSSPVRMFFVSLSCLLLSSSFIVMTPSVAQAQTAAITGSVLEITTPPLLSGMSHHYALQLQCSALTEFLCKDVTAEIPLPAGHELAEIQSNPFISGVSTTGNLMTISFEDIPAGTSFNIPLEIALYNGITPNGTTWDVEATLAGSNVSTYTTNAVTSEASASPYVHVEKWSFHAGQLWGYHPDLDDAALNSVIRYYIMPCKNGNDAVGELWLESGTVVDNLPTGSTFVASSAGGVHDAGLETVTWTVASGDIDNIEQCGGKLDISKDFFWVEVSYPSTDPALEDPFGLPSSVTNNAVIDGLPYGETTPVSDSDSITHGFQEVTINGNMTKRPYTLYHKGQYSNTHYDAPYSSSGHYYTVSYTNTSLSSFSTAITDPLPCLDNVTGSTYGGTDYESQDVGDICTNPAINVTSVATNINNAPPNRYYVESEFDATYTPFFVGTDGVTYDWELDRHLNYTAFWKLPASLPAGVIPAEVGVPAIPIDAASKKMTLTIYFDTGDTLVASDYLINEAHASTTFGSDTLDVSVKGYVDIIEPENFLYVFKRATSTGSTTRWQTYFSNLATEPKVLVVSDLLPATQNISDVENIVYGYFYEGEQLWGTYDLSLGAFDPGEYTGTAPAADVEIIENFEGTGRTMIRLTTLYPADPGKTASLTINFADPPAVSVGSYYNEVSVGFEGEDADGCFLTSGALHVDPSLLNTDVDDWDGDDSSSDINCFTSATMNIPGDVGILQSQKYVRGDLDSQWRTYPVVASITPGSTASFRYDFFSAGNVPLQDIIVYDVFPVVGDTGTSGTQVGTSRDTEWNPVFAGYTSLPAGWVVEYSSAADPCRGEVADPAVALASWPAACTNDWTVDSDRLEQGVSVVDFTTVTAVRLSFAGPMASGTSASFEWDVTTPGGVLPGEIAWNSAAATAVESNTLLPLRPSEPPKVGLGVPQTDVSVTKSYDGSSPALGGTPQPFTVTVSHDGSVTNNADGSVTYVGVKHTAFDLVVSDLVPAGASYVPFSSSTGACGTFDEGNVALLVPQLSPGQSCSVTFNIVTPLSAGSHTNYAEVTSFDQTLSGPDVDSQPDENELSDGSPNDQDDEASASFNIEAPLIELDKLVEDSAGSGVFIEADASDGLTGVYDSGEPVAYRFVISNPTNFAIENVELSDDITGFECDQSVGTLAANDSVSIDCVWPFGFAPSSVVNTATVTGEVIADGASVPVSATDTAEILVLAPTPDPSVSVTKRVFDAPSDSFINSNAAPGGLYALGDTVVWQVVVTNTSEATYNTVASDLLVPGCSVDLGVMTPGEVEVYTCASEALSGSFENTVVVDVTTDDGKTASGSDTEWYTGVSSSSLELEKEVINDNSGTAVPDDFNLEAE